jgi:hypothetical protein
VNNLIIISIFVPDVIKIRLSKMEDVMIIIVNILGRIRNVWGAKKVLSIIRKGNV